jgi:hypothetical protein
LLISTPDREAAVAVPPPVALLPVSLPPLPPPQPDTAASAAIAIAVGQSLVMSSLLGRWSPPRQSLDERSATRDRDHVIVTALVRHRISERAELAQLGQDVDHRPALGDAAVGEPHDHDLVVPDGSPRRRQAEVLAQMRARDRVAAGHPVAVDDQVLDLDVQVG